MRRRFPLLAALAAAFVTLPASASAAILEVRIDTAAGPSLCVTTNARGQLGDRRGRPPRRRLARDRRERDVPWRRSATAPRAAASGRCCRSAASTAPPGRRSPSADSTGASIDGRRSPWPASRPHTGGFSGSLHLRNLPAVAGTQITNGGSLPLTAVTSGALRQRRDRRARPRPSRSLRRRAACRSGPTSRREAVRRRRERRRRLDRVTVHGADPSGGAVAIDLLAAAGGSPLRTASAPARIGSGLDATAALPFARQAAARSPSRRRARGRRARGSATRRSRPTASASRSRPRPRGCAAQHTPASPAPTRGRSRCTIRRRPLEPRMRSGPATRSGRTSRPRAAAADSRPPRSD